LGVFFFLVFFGFFGFFFKAFFFVGAGRASVFLYDGSPPLLASRYRSSMEDESCGEEHSRREHSLFLEKRAGRAEHKAKSTLKSRERFERDGEVAANRKHDFYFKGEERIS